MNKRLAELLAEMNTANAASNAAWVHHGATTKAADAAYAAAAAAHDAYIIAYESTQAATKAYAAALKK